MTSLDQVPNVINLPEIVEHHFFKAEFPKYIIAKVTCGTESKNVFYINPDSEDDHLTLEDELKKFVGTRVNSAAVKCIGGGRIAYAPGVHNSCILGVTGQSSIFGTENKGETVEMLRAAFPTAEKIVAF